MESVNLSSCHLLSAYRQYAVGKGNLRLIRDKAHRRPCDPMRPGSPYHADLIPVRKLRFGESSGYQAIGCLLDLDTSMTTVLCETLIRWNSAHNFEA